jgi:glycosyltransferase involved in cell wall biosynthesis
MTKVTILVAAYNEEKTIIRVLESVNQQVVPGISFEILVVDDGSSDSTVALLEKNPKLYTRLIKMPDNGGKGAAIKAGLAAATGDYVLFQDADLEYDPADYARLMMPVIRFSADIVMGSRIAAPPCTRVAYFWHKVGNRALTLVFNVLNNTTFTDIYSCYLMFRRSLIDPRELKTLGWEQQAEILTLAVKRSRVYYEVPICYYGRTYEEGKKIRAHHVIGVIRTIIARGLFGR